MSLWLIGWSAGCVMVLKQAVADPSLLHVLFAIPFVASWFAVGGALICLLFGRQRLSIGPDGVQYEFRALLPLRRRAVPLDELKHAVAAVSHATPNWGSGADSDCRQATPCIRIETLGKPVDFAYDVDPDERCWLLERINERIGDLQSHYRPFDRQPVAATQEEPLPRQNGDREILLPAHSPVARPSDCRFTLTDDFEGLRFTRSGHWSLAAIAGTTFVALFWNGIVSVFVLELIRDFQWFLFFFLIPFEVLGLLIFVGWLLALVAPARRDSWTVLWQEITHRRSLFGLGWTRHYQIDPLDRIELQRRINGGQQQAAVDLTDSGGEYLLSFISREQQILLQVKQLTEGEARWIADQILRRYSNWFPHRA